MSTISKIRRPRFDTKLKLNNIDPALINISFSCQYYLDGWLGDAEPDDFIQVYHIDIELHKFTNTDIVREDLLGSARCYYLSGYDNTNETFVDLRDYADADSGDLLIAVIPVTDEKGMVLDEYQGSDILYVDKFYIKPQYRGKGIGQPVFASILDVIGRNVGVITIIPTPSEDDGNERINKDDPWYKPQLKMMTNFIKKFGFYEVDKENRVWAKNTQYI